MTEKEFLPTPYKKPFDLCIQDQLFHQSKEDLNSLSIPRQIPVLPPKHGRKGQNTSHL
jgi:hypothetical protein